MKSQLSTIQKLRLLARDFRDIALSPRRGSRAKATLNPERPGAFFDLYLFKWPIVYVPILGAAILALAAPLDVMDRVVWLRQLSDAIRAVFLPMDGYIKRSAFPQVTELYFLLMVLHSPVHFFGMRHEIGSPYNRAKAAAAWMKATLSAKARLLVVWPIAVACLPVFFVLNPGFDFAIAPINTSRIALGVVGWLFAGGMGFVLTGLLTALARNIASARYPAASL